MGHVIVLEGPRATGLEEMPDRSLEAHECGRSSRTSCRGRKSPPRSDCATKSRRPRCRWCLIFGERGNETQTAALDGRNPKRRCTVLMQKGAVCYEAGPGLRRAQSVGCLDHTFVVTATIIGLRRVSS